METSITPGADSAAPGTLLPLSTSNNEHPIPPNNPHPIPPNNQEPITIILPPPLKPREPLSADISIGTVVLRTPAEDVEFQECERIMGEGWGHIAQMGEALTRIRDKQLYKNDYASFEVYCQQRWGLGHSTLWRHLAAAQVQRTLAAIPGMPLPDCEAQIRPLIGLSADLAVQAWIQAIGWSQDAYVPPTLVKRSVKQLLKIERPPVLPEPNASRQHRYRVRESIRTGFKELLTLLFGKLEREVLIAKVQELQKLLEPMLNSKKKRA